MAETTYDRTKPQKRFTAAVSRGLRESAVLAIGVIALVMLIALMSYHRTDPGFASTGNAGLPAQNLIGPFGAWLASLLFFLFGQPAFLFPIMLSVACFVMFRKPDDEEGRTRYNTAVRIAGFTLMLVASCGLATLHWSAGDLPASAGGAVGHRRQDTRVGHEFPRRDPASCWRRGWPAWRCRLESPGSPSSTRSAPGSGTPSAGSRPGAARPVTSPSASKPRRRGSRRPRWKRSAWPRASSHASRHLRRWSKRASASRRNARFRCSTRRSPANCRRSSC